MNHFLITGGSGFIGSNLAARLETVGKIVLCDHPITEEKARNLEKRKPFQFIDQSELFSWLETSAPQFDHVFHLGASSSTTVTDVEYLTRNNTEPAKLIWRYCTKHQIGLTYASSAATYGDGSIGFDDDPNLLPRLRPLNPYAQSKHDFDCWAMDQAAKASAPPRWFAMKFFNVFGPNEFHKGWQSSVFPNLVRQIRETGEAQLFASPRADIGNGEQLRDFIHVDDCIDHMLHLRANGAPSGIYNSATG
ncbi:MAG: NAD-dependent epimerase/dehydratase family protein, partial [Pseudomonadota bacterium]